MTWTRCSPAAVRVLALAIGLWSAHPALGQQPDTRVQYAPVPGGRLEYEVQGQGEPVLLIHGVIVADLLRPLAAEPALSHYRVIVLHRRGYAGSSSVGDTWSVEQDAADAAALLRYLGIARAHIVGHSAGGIVALELASRSPEMVQTLTLLDPPLLNFAHAQKLKPRMGGADSVVAFLLARGGPDLKQQLEARLPGALQQARRDERRFNVVEWAALGAWAFDGATARRVTAPVLFVSQLHRPDVDTARAWWPTMEFVELKGATHLFPFEAPAATAEAMAGFLSRHAM